MRQRSATPSSEQHTPMTPATRYRGNAQRTGARLSLPQRRVIVESTLATPVDTTLQPPSDTAALHTAPGESRELVPAPEEITPLPAAPTSAEIHLIPRTLPPTRAHKQRWRRSPRASLLKLSLIAIVSFTVLSATLATAGGGQVFRYLSNALGSLGPYAPATPKPAFITQRVHPLTQWNPDAGYDSQAQRDAYWNSACSAAVLTELLTAWGVPNITIGRMIDELGPDITPWGGLMTQNAWNRIAQMHNMHATVYLNRQLNYNDIVQLTVQKGIPVILDLRDSYGRYYPALYGGHFLIAVGGSAIGLDVVDSSLYHITFISTDQLDYLWERGEAIVILPN